jgi:dihydroxyacetone kinase-like protein
MMGAVQPSISGAISKTVNMPNTTTVEDIAEAYTEAWRKGIQGVQARGKAQLGDKTMLDALVPGVEALEKASELDSGLREAAAAAESGMRDTIPLVARKGRASYLGERSKDHQDPGSTSTFYLYQTAADALTG